MRETFPRVGNMVGGMFLNYPITVTGLTEGRTDMFEALLHLSEDVRIPLEHIRLHEDFLYKGDWSKDEYRMFSYEKVELTPEEVVNILKKVLYFYQPRLRSSTMMGWASREEKDNPNYVSGTYLLNDEKLYTILKRKGKFRILEGEHQYMSGWNIENPLFEGEINFDIYELSLKYWECKRKLVQFPNVWLDTNREIYEDFLDAEWKLKMDLDIDQKKNKENFSVMEEGLNKAIHLLQENPDTPSAEIHSILKETISLVESKSTGCFYEKTALDYIRNLYHAVGTDCFKEAGLLSNIENVKGQVLYMARQ